MSYQQLLVRIFAKTENGEKFRGTGFLINDDYVLTARHVIEPFRHAFMQINDILVLRNGPWNGDQYLNKVIPHPNEKIDIALLKLRMPNREQTEYLPFAEYALKDSVTIAGFENANIASSEASFELLAQNNKFYTYDVQGKVQHGKSGGPVMLKNSIVGIVYARTDDPDAKKDENKTFIYPYSVFKDFVLQQTKNKQAKQDSEIDFDAICPEIRAALIDRKEQWDRHILRRITDEKQQCTFAFVIAAVREEWPEALKLRLCILLNLPIKQVTKINLLKYEDLDKESWEKYFLLSLLEVFPTTQDDLNDLGKQALKNRLINELIDSETPVVYSCFLDKDVCEKLPYLRCVIECWESLNLPGAKCRHFLLIVYGIKERGKSGVPGFSWLSRNRSDRQVEQWLQQFKASLSKPNQTKVVIPLLQSPDKLDINHWVDNHLNGIEQNRFDNAIKKIKGDRIAHRTLRDTYLTICHPPNS